LESKNLLRIKEQHPPVTDSDGSLAITDIENANLSGKNLSKIFTLHANIIPNSEHLELSSNEILFLIKKRL